MALTEAIVEQARKLLPGLHARLAALTEDQRRDLDDARGNRDLAGGTAPLSREIADRIVDHRPLRLASILGTPRRIPLHPCLFDLVVFDEASRCDIPWQAHAAVRAAVPMSSHVRLGR